ncbi:MAG: ABC transporter permease, partial [Myxococcales bacterium]|nr:ABC transporter permease [Myxococcales bacterium]
MTRLTRALVRKDLRLFLTDRRAVIVSFALPALLALFFGATLGGGGQKPPKVATAVVDLDGSAASKRLVAALAADPVLGATVVATADEARDLVRHERAEVAFVIPAGFAGDAAAAAASPEDHPARPAVTVLSDPTRGLSTSVARGELERAVMPALAPDLGAEATRCATRGLPYETTMSSVGSGDSGFDYGAHALAGMGIQFILIGAIDSAVGLITDRQRGLLKRIHAAPVARRTLILSRLLSGAL